MLTCGAVLSALLACGDDGATNGTGTGDTSATTGGSTTASSESGTTTGASATTDGTGTSAASDATGTTGSTTGAMTGSTTGSTTGESCPAELSCLNGLLCCGEGEGCVGDVECYKKCNPLQPDCARFEHCSPFQGVPFVCYQEGDPGAVGDPCANNNSCDSGLVCLVAAVVQGCGTKGCCAPLCDLSNPIPCPGDMETCQPWFEGMAPAGYENLGVCALPG